MLIFLENSNSKNKNISDYGPCLTKTPIKGMAQRLSFTPKLNPLSKNNGTWKWVHIIGFKMRGCF